MPTEFDAKVIEEFRANDGRVGGVFERMPMLLLHHTGARSGTTYVNPLAYLRDGADYVIIASKAGAPENPAWYHNLAAHPETTIEVGPDTLPVRARPLSEGPERDRLYGAMAEQAPQFREYQQQTERTIPVVVLTPAGD